MAVKSKPAAPAPKSGPKPAPNGDGPTAVNWFSPPATAEDRLVRIRLLGDRIADHVKFMAAAAGLPGTSAEVRDRSLGTFYERLLVVERQLERIRDELQLG
jgi:hypothetical protein